VTWTHAPTQIQFQSTPPRGGRRCPRGRPRGPSTVSIHAPAWGATVPGGDEGAPGGFNPRPRVGGDSSGPRNSLARWVFQSTPPRGGRRAGRCWRTVPARVSIHAPAWGATAHARRRDLEDVVSIHAPAWGATRVFHIADCVQWFQSTPPRGGRRRGRSWCRAGRSRFNPRPRVGGDRVCGGYRRAGGRVSIHAPAWGATTCGRSRRIARASFNPRPRVGGDPVTPTGSTWSCGFNPRPRVGGDDAAL